jgi:hypothetical protein
MSSTTNTGNFEKAIAAFDAYHQEDPHRENVGGQQVAGELLYARRMTEKLLDFAPDAGEAMKLAARCQHIGRWEIPREKYPMDKKGYLLWRNEEKIHHARVSEKILSACGYDAATIEKVRLLLLKKELFTNPDTQLLEDVVCLVFIEFYLEDFTAKHNDEKIIDILRKTLKKMSARSKQWALQINLSQKIRSLLEQAVKST